MSSKLIELQGITKSYSMGKNLFWALKGIDLTVEEGDFLAIMGPSGSGKSTLMNIIGCLDRATSGKYLLKEEDVSFKHDNELATIRNSLIGFAFQSFHLLHNYTSLDNVMLPLSYAGLPRAQRREKAQNMMERMGLSEKLFNRPSELSGGERQRVALARALVNDPSLLCADEPTGNLDSKTGHEIMQFIHTLNLQEGLTILLVTHEREIADYAKRIIYMRDGMLSHD